MMRRVSTALTPRRGPRTRWRAHGDQLRALIREYWRRDARAARLRRAAFARGTAALALAVTQYFRSIDEQQRGAGASILPAVAESSPTPITTTSASAG